MLRRFIKCIPVILAIALIFIPEAQAEIKQEEKAGDWIKLSSPQEGATFIGKKPVINCVICHSLCKRKSPCHPRPHGYNGTYRGI